MADSGVVGSRVTGLGGGMVVVALSAASETKDEDDVCAGKGALVLEPSSPGGALWCCGAGGVWLSERLLRILAAEVWTLLLSGAPLAVATLVSGGAAVELFSSSRVVAPVDVKEARLSSLASSLLDTFFLRSSLLA